MINERKQESLDYRRSIGASLGGRPKTNKSKEGLIMRLRNEGCSYRNIRDQTGLTLETKGAKHGMRLFMPTMSKTQKNRRGTKPLHQKVFR
tara:strand:- start:1 stop:273 length:273 start_codon:yes stop_codon:yes gene_type:complete